MTLVNYPQLSQGAFHRSWFKVHSTETKTIIGTQESVYRDSPAGKLDVFVPLQQGFYSDSNVRMPAFSHSTAVATPYTLPGEVKTLSGEYRKSDGDRGCGSSPPSRKGSPSHGW